MDADLLSGDTTIAALQQITVVEQEQVPQSEPLVCFSFTSSIEEFRNKKNFIYSCNNCNLTTADSLIRCPDLRTIILEVIHGDIYFQRSSSTHNEAVEDDTIVVQPICDDEPKSRICIQRKTGDVQIVISEHQIRHPGDLAALTLDLVSNYMTNLTVFFSQTVKCVTFEADNLVTKSGSVYLRWSSVFISMFLYSCL